MRLLNAAAVRRHRGRSNKAFTLLELIVVVVVIAIIAAIVIANNMQTTAEAQIRAGEQSLAAIARNADTLRAGVPRAPFAASDFDPTDNGVQFAYNQATSDPDTISVWLPGPGSDRTVGLAKLTNSGTCVYLYVDRGQRSFANSDDGICSGEFADDPTNAVDTDGPTITVSGLADGASINGTVDITILATDTSGVNTVTADIDGTPITLTDNGDGTWSYEWDTTGLTGEHSLNVTADDVEGNTSTDTTTVTVELPDLGFVVADATSLTADEQVVHDLYVNRGFNVTLIDMDDRNTFDFSTIDVAVVTKNVGGWEGRDLENALLNVPQIALGYRTADVGPGGSGRGSWDGYLETVTPDHPIAEGLSSVSIDIVDNTAGWMGASYAHDDATVVFRLSGGIYVTGVISRDYAARHVLIGVDDYSALNTTGEQLYVNAALWAGKDVPNPPQNLTVSRSIGGTADITWDPTTTPSTSYLVQHRVAASGADWNTQTVSGTSASVSGLSDTTVYEFRIRGVNGLGNGQASDEVFGHRPLSGTITMSVGDTNSPDPQIEQPFIDELQAQGLTVNLVNHTDLETADFTGTDLLVVAAQDTNDSAFHPYNNIESLGVPTLSLTVHTAVHDLNLGASGFHTTTNRMKLRNLDHFVSQPYADDTSLSNMLHYTSSARTGLVNQQASDTQDIAVSGYYSDGISSIAVNDNLTKGFFGAFRGDLLNKRGWALFHSTVAYMAQDRPDTPDSPRLTAGDSQITVEWDAVADADSYEVSYREFSNYLNFGPLTVDGTTAGTSYTLTGLANGSSGTGQLHGVYVRAVDADGNTSALSPVRFAPSIADRGDPITSHPVAVAVADTNNLTGDENLLVSYLQTIGVTVTTVADADVATHDYTGTDVLVLPPTSTVDATTVSSMTVPVVVMDGDVMAGLLGSTSSTSQDRQMRYISYDTMFCCGSINDVNIHLEDIDSVPAGTLHIAAGELASGNEMLGGAWAGRRVAFYGAQLPHSMALDGWEILEEAIEWTATPGSFPPASSDITRTGADSIDVTWTPGNGPTPDSYEVRYRTPGAATWTDVTGLTGTNHTVTGLDANSGYEVQVRAVLDGVPSDWTSLQATGQWGAGTTVVFNVKDDTSVDPSLEQPFIDRLNNHGYTVQLVSDADLPTWTPTGDVLVVRPHDATALAAHPTYSNFDTIGMPVLTLDPTVANGDMGLVNNNVSITYQDRIGVPSSQTVMPEIAGTEYTVYEPSGKLFLATSSSVDQFAYWAVTTYRLGTYDESGTHKQSYLGLVEGDKLTGMGGYLFDQAVYWTAN